jgi:hypothetical protein
MMPLDLVQDGVVTLVAGLAGILVFRRVLGFVRPTATPGCANCPSTGGDCAAPAAERATEAPTSHPIVLVRPSATPKR